MYDEILEQEFIDQLQAQDIDEYSIEEIVANARALGMFDIPKEYL